MECGDQVTTFKNGTFQLDISLLHPFIYKLACNDECNA